MVRPSVEQLEDRTLAAVTTTLTNGVLTIAADNQTNYLVVSTPTTGVTEVFDAVANKTNDFTGVSSIRFQGGQGNNTFYNDTALPSIQQANNNPGKTTVLVGGKTNDVLDGSQAKGDVYETLTANGIELGGAGLSNLFALGGTHVIVGGSGRNAIYSIVGVDQIDGGTGPGYVFVGAKATVKVNPNEQVVTFFQTVFAQQTSPVFYQRDRNGNGILYLLPQSPVSVSYVVNQVGTGANTQIVVNYSDASGAKQTATFLKSSVQWLAFFSITGTSQITNNSSVSDVFYGKSGSTFTGGFGDVDVLKLHTSGGMLVGRARYTDLFSGPGATSSTLVLGGHQGVFRNNAAVQNTIDFNAHKDSVVIGVPGFLGKSNPDNGLTATNKDYLWLSQIIVNLQKNGN